MHARIRAYDWTSTSLGPIDTWPQSLRATLKTVLGSRYPMVLLWGDELLQLYNDAYIGLIGQKHPVLGRSIRETQAESWGTIGPMIREVMTTGVPNWVPAQQLPLERAGYREEAYFSLSYSAVDDDFGRTTGMLCVCSEVTQQVIGERRLRLLRDLALRLGETRTVDATCRDVTAAISEYVLDVPFALLYARVPDGDGKAALELKGSVGVAQAPDEADEAALCLSRAARGEVVHLDAVPAGLQTPGGPWADPVHEALVMPLASADPSEALGVLVAGISPSRAVDEGYRSFYELLAAQVAVALRNAHAREHERRRAEALAELDLAKTTFFSNVSHEFRTPLTLILGPLEDALADANAALPPVQRERVEVIRRNALRMFKLVNTLLDFSRIEAGRANARYEPTDLAALTQELVSLFRSAIERAGLTLSVDVAPLDAPVYVDREMWEKVVLNLLSNAVKFTLQGGISVSLKARGEHAFLTVRDTGTGIPPDELPHVFERFHRVRGAHARSHEGSGIGLALVHELSRLHGGDVQVESTPGEGTTFTVSLRLGTAHLPSERVAETAVKRPAATGAGTAVALVEEASRWTSAPLPASTTAAEADAPEVTPGVRTRILVADDNADLRDYIAGLLSPAFEVETVADGVWALEAMRARRPDLVLSDVMMPRLDGLGLLRELRADPGLCDVPVILLSARAGEESTLDALGTGADDYLVKPFSARELRARVAARLELTAMRRTTAQQEQALAALEGHRQWTQVLLNSFPVPLLLVDPSDGSLNFANAAADVLGLRSSSPAQPRVQYARTHWFRDAGGRPLSLEEVPSVRAARGEQVRDLELEWEGPAGRASLVVDAVPLPAVGGHDAEVAVTFRDVTERRRLEQHQRLLAEAGKRLSGSLDLDVTLRNVARLAVPALADVCCVEVAVDEDGATQRIVVAQRDGAAEEWPGTVSKEQATTTARAAAPRFDPALSPGDAQEISASLQALDPGSSFLRDLRPVSRLEVPLESREGGVFGTLSLISTDRSQRRDAAQELAAAEDFARTCALALDNARLFQQAQRAIRFRDEFLSVASHELKTPLTPLLIQLRSISKRAPELARDDAAQAWLHQHVGTVERQARRLNRLIDELLDLSRLMGGRLQLQREPVDLADLVQASVGQLDELGEFTRSGCPPHVEVPAGIVGHWDRFRLDQVITNLLSNACKYGERKPITLSARTVDGNAIIEVRDQGIGIAAEDQERIFAKFERAVSVRHYGGLGLGLFIVRQVLDAMGGNIRVSSQPALGACFIVTLPLTAPAD